MKIKKSISVLLAAVLSVTLLLGTAMVANATDYEESFIKRIPLKDKYTKAIDEAGTLETVTYTTHGYAIDGEEETEVEKVMQVYLPYGYDPANQYNVVYLMHGGGESEYYWLNDVPVYEGTKAMGKTTRGMIDNMQADGKIDPTIFVAPTTNTEVNGKRAEGFDGFAEELRKDIIPYIESHYSTYAAGDVSEENLKATRDHRAFCGFSMGSMCTISAAMMKTLDLISYFGAFSGAKADINTFKPAIESFGVDVKYMYNGNGTADIAHDEHEEFVQDILEQMPETFQDGVNFAWIDFKGGSHAYNCWIVDLYNCMLVFFKK